MRNRPKIFIESFYPIAGPVVRRSVAASLRVMMRSFNQTLEHAFSWQGLKWRVEAIRTGRSFGEVVLLRSLIYRVEQVFLIHRETSLLLLHAGAEGAGRQDSDMIAGTLSAIQDFSRDSFQAGADAALEEFRVGDLEVWIAVGPRACLAAVIRGNPPRELHRNLEEALESAHTLKGSAMAGFTGDASVFETLRPELEACLKAQYEQPAKSEEKLTLAWLALGGAAAMVLAAAYFFLRTERRWDAFVQQLGAEPGIALTAEAHGWFSPSHVAGLRDPLAADPAPLARQAGLDPERIRFDWKDYLALDDTSVRRRFEQRFGAPEGTRIAVVDGAIEVSGTAPYEWIERVRRDSAQVPGVNALREREVKVSYDPALVLQRFRDAFPPPKDVTASFADGILHLSGSAAYEWIEPVRAGATRLAGITGLADQKLRVTYDPALVLQRFASRFSVPDTVKPRSRMAC